MTSGPGTVRPGRFRCGTSRPRSSVHVSAPVTQPSSSTNIAPALTPEEWRSKTVRRAGLGTYEADVIALAEDGRTLRLASEADGELVLVPEGERHAVAALALHGQPFGFSAQDVEDEVDVAGYCEAMARQSAEAGAEAQAATFRMLAQRHRLRAAKIAALLPPLDASAHQ
jgi:hypothetical protein